MGLNEYNIINKKIDKTKTWIDTSLKQIISREFNNRYLYYSFAYKFDEEKQDNFYYIIHSKDKQPNSKYVTIDDYGRIKIKCNEIFTNLGFNSNDYDQNIKIELVEQTNEYDIYKIDC